MDMYLLLAFIPAALALNLTPGADMLFCLGQGLKSGKTAAIAASAGVSMGSMVHTAIAGLGLGVVVATVPWVFDLIRWIGVAYLLWLAITAFRSTMAESEDPPLSPKHAFQQGFLVNITNPKVILFVLAFLPQFVSPEAGYVLIQFLTLGAVIATGGFVINAMVGAFAGGVGTRLVGSRRFQKIIGYVTATIFGALAVRLAIMERS